MLAGLLALAALMPGCAAPSDGGDPGTPGLSAETGVLAGIVVDAALRPLADAQVSATPPGGEPLRTATDVNGSFAFVGLAPGTYAVEATKERHLSAHAIAQVAAGEAGPLVQLVLEVQADEVPFAVVVKWEGYIGCAFSYGNLCSAPAQGGADVIGDQSAHLFWDEYVAEGRVPDLVQAEAVWEATLPTSEELQPIFGWSTPDEWRVFQYGGTFDSFSTPSPAFYRVPYEEMLEVGLGTDVGLVVEFYSGDPGGAPAGLTINQPIRLFLHNFYGYT
ncbi:MAG TPA: carboxypeptidase-like regulatory domain-containing protein, partial [Candidatus Thermoplasmatota archaeon]|nr:carboxypeptidase-like regulatory domain-containing protein [Candidatus Thermoplasmatota archaeon]